MSTNSNIKRLAVLVILMIFLNGGVRADELENGFINPPKSARPHTWWHWLNGNISREGIRKDLEWMAKMGLGGVQNFNANLGTPVIVDKPLLYMTAEWKEAFAYAVKTADELGLDFAIASSPGWSETGGPWVAPEDGMKKLVWAERYIEDGVTGSVEVPEYPCVTGSFHDIELEKVESFGGELDVEIPKFCGHIRLIAVPFNVPAEQVPTVTDSQGHALDFSALSDHSLQSIADVAAKGSEPPAIHFRYQSPITLRSVTFYIPEADAPFRDPLYRPVFQAFLDGEWVDLAEGEVAVVPTTLSFPATVADHFRLVIASNPVPEGSLDEPVEGAISFDAFAMGRNEKIAVALARPSAEARVHQAEAKAGFALLPDYYEVDTPILRAEYAKPSQVIDLTDQMREDGSIDWQPPADGRWKLINLGFSLLGSMNHPAPAEATGLEVDKLDGSAVSRYLESYLDLYRDSVPKELIGETGLNAFLTDSYEAGSQNWTEKLIDKFGQMRGYDPTPWLPVLTGMVIENESASDAFLYDFRRTLADLLAREHYATVADFARRNKLIYYGEALEDGRPVLADGMQIRSYADIPMSALWTFNRGAEPRASLLGDMKGASSVANVYGQNVVAAESMTAAFSPWAFAPRDLKRIIDLEFIYGINRPVIHTSAHHPLEDKLPGLSLAIFGQYFNRHDVWAPMARTWIDYISRTSYMLQQGRSYSDIAYFYGEEAPLTGLYKHKMIDHLPQRYSFDFVNADVVASLLDVENGKLVTPSQQSYHVLFLGGTSLRMTLPTLQAIEKLVNAGATVVGLPPVASPSLADDQDVFADIVKKLWAGGEVTRYGEGKVFGSHLIESVLGDLGVPSDFDYVAENPDAQILFSHRQFEDQHIYFVSNRRNQTEKLRARFRVAGKHVELWNAIDGTVMPTSFEIIDDHTYVEMELAAEDSVFVVFRSDTKERSITVKRDSDLQVASLNDDWRIEFQPQRGAPSSTLFGTLAPLNEAEADGIKYFSGIATYQKVFDLTARKDSGRVLMMDLGEVGDVAELHLNGQYVGTRWFPPFQFEISKYVLEGENELEVKVANTWVNRLIGDKQPDVEPISFTVAPTYTPTAPLRPSGLIGPVRILERTLPDEEK